MGPSPDTLLDGGFQTGSYGGVINGYYYTFDTVDHDMPGSSATANNADGTPAGGVFVRGKEKIAVSIKARTGTPVPAARVPFRMAFDGQPEKNWVVVGAKISSSNEGASIRTYSGEIEEYINPIPL